MKNCLIITIFLLAAINKLSVALKTNEIYQKYQEILFPQAKNQKQQNNINVQINTECNFVSLQNQFNYSGVVRSGYLSVNKGNSALGFIFYGKQDQTDYKALSKYPTIIWLNGGPGYSSQIGNFQQIGPLLLTRILKQTLKKNPATWVIDFNLLFIDNPVGTGLSYADPTFKNSIPTNVNDVANDFWVAISELYNNAQGCFSNQKLNMPGSAPIYIFGQGIAGKYAAAIGEKIMKMKQSGGFLTGLKGIGIGNGLVAPYKIMAESANFAYQLGLVDFQQRSRLQKVLLNATNHYMNQRTKQLAENFLIAMTYVSDVSGVSPYDITLDLSDKKIQEVTTFLQNQKNIETFSLKPQIKFNEFSKQVFDAQFADFMTDKAQSVEYLLSKNIFVLVYQGQDDLMVPNPGAMRWVDDLKYSDSQSFRQTLLSPWKIGEKMVGSMKKVGALQLRIINQAGHQVPLRKPNQVLNMIRSFVKSTLV